MLPDVVIQHKINAYYFLKTYFLPEHNLDHSQTHTNN